MFLLGKWQTRTPNIGGGGKVDRSIVAEFRRYVQQEGFGLEQGEQIRHLQQTAYGYGLNRATLSEILGNRSWYDPSYTPGEPDRDYWGRHGSVPLMLCRMLAQ
jgi:hypothetical protein